ncbi:MAG: 4-hydroxyphenylpyruvate dioxygenase [Novosphingobium sp.]|nr:4-hydroxyphenylpyruvate dioxygenase [Novosphingobium sp.]MBX9645103.1 4-hydroxyphenylpyruvate dioxygenase [Novosphingobium sp.]
MPDLFENPLGLDGFEFVEFCAPQKGLLEPVFEIMGFTLIARHRSKDVQLWRQGEINLIANYEPRSPAAYFAAEHGASACGMAFRVRDAAAAYKEAIERGAEPVESRTGVMELRIPAIKGIGGAFIYLVDRYATLDNPDALSIYDIDFVYEPGVDRHPVGAGFKTIDHLTHNVYGGRMAHWGAWYERIFNFREIRYFDIKGEYTGLTSRAMTAPDGKIRIPLNEEGPNLNNRGAGGGQIEEFLREYNGEGIQHIALICDDLVRCWDNLKQLGVPFMTAPPATYYAMLDGRLPGHGQPVDALQQRGILLDGSTEGGSPRLLLQIFAQPQIGPVFFEFIQRKGDEGFGEGNFKALFESIERDQIERGVLKVAE